MGEIIKFSEGNRGNGKREKKSVLKIEGEMAIKIYTDMLDYLNILRKDNQASRNEENIRLSRYGLKEKSNNA